MAPIVARPRTQVSYECTSACGESHPSGIRVSFGNLGGEVFDAVLPCLISAARKRGRRLENAPTALAEVLQGRNFGKRVLRLATDGA